jgi:hypothetical protein
LTVAAEYVPLRDALTPIIIRAQAIMEHAARQAAAHQASQVEGEDLDNYDSDGAVPPQGIPEPD